MSLGDDKASCAHLREACVESQQVFRGHFLDVRRDQVRLPDGKLASREYIVHPGAVAIVALLDDGQFVLERQFRYPLGRAVIEFPAGKLGRGEDPWHCAVRELHEETGYRAREWAYAGILHNAIAYCDEGIEIWFARGLSLGERHLDEGEFLDVFTATPQALMDGVRDGQVTDAKTLIALLWWQQWQAGAWPLTWQPEPMGVLSA
ncbi:MAG: NUDIX domain-containing protein [Leptothrix ochracea]|uniref:NUDIX domain-containing protein n=1 Tax=Leptothrix ochracea TaxID=735331 RepID=UPI0034E1E0F8